MDSIIASIERAVIALTAGRQSDAVAALGEINFGALVDVRRAAHGRARNSDGVAGYRSPLPWAARRPPRSADVRATFARDRYTCRYVHCGRPTVALEVLKLVSQALPEVLPYHPNWRPVERHILYWTYSTSVEHVVRFPAGGTSAAENLVAACYLCNDVKNCVPLDLLGWRVGPPPETLWCGLTEYVPELRDSVGRIQPSSGA